MKIRYILILIAIATAMILLSGCRYRLSYAAPDNDTATHHDTTHRYAEAQVPPSESSEREHPEQEPHEQVPPGPDEPDHNDIDIEDLDDDIDLHDDENQDDDALDEDQDEIDDSDDLNDQDDYEYPEDSTPNPPPDQTQHQSNIIPEIDATPYTPSPQTMEIVTDDARQYATAEGYLAGTQVGTQAYQQTGNTITVDTPTDEGDGAVLSQGDDGGIVGVIAVYSTLLRQGVNTMFPCQMLYIYAETTTDLVTVARGSEIYRLMADAGGLNVSSRLSTDMLTVTAEWVVRRNPSIIVKFVEPTILGSNISDTIAATQKRQSIIAREGWGTIDAVINNRVILLSTQLLETEETRLAAKLSIARLMYPTLFAEVDAATVIAELLGNAQGIYVFY